MLEDFEKNVLLAPYTTYKIGGSADYFYRAKDKNSLVKAIVWARENKFPYFVLGLGANILFGDKGFRGLVIKNECQNILIKENIITVDSGVTIADLIEETKNKNLSGFEHYAGIPSTIGGALWQNLHFLSPDRKDTVFIESILNSAEILGENNKIVSVTKDFFKFGYDYSILHDKKLIVTEATFVLEYKNKDLIEKQIKENLKWRNEKQPQLPEFPSCGSVFKKIDGVGAGRLIEAVGLKGFQIGGAKISEKHANYIVNTGNASAEDVLKVISTIKDKIKASSGHEMTTEISLIGEF